MVFHAPNGAQPVLNEVSSELLTITDDYDYSPHTSDGEEGMSWIAWFCSLSGHEFYTEVPKEFIADNFNLTGLISVVDHFKEALQTILDFEADDDDMNNRIPDVSIINPHAEMLYGMIHQRFITTKMGMRQMLSKYREGHFGYCPRVYCNRIKVLPCGLHDIPHKSKVHLYCPNCKDVYTTSHPRYRTVEGAHFGTTFAHLLVEEYKDYIELCAQPQIYVPRVLGFRVHESSHAAPKMRWLRQSPIHHPPQSHPADKNNAAK